MKCTFRVKVASDIAIFHLSLEQTQCLHSHWGASILADKGDNIDIFLIFLIGFFTGGTKEGGSDSFGANNIC